MKHTRRTIVIRIALLAGGLFLALTGAPWLGKRAGNPAHSLAATDSSLFPNISFPLAVRFDPSYYYNGKRPSRLARELDRLRRQDDRCRCDLDFDQFIVGRVTAVRELLPGHQAVAICRLQLRLNHLLHSTPRLQCPPISC